MADMILTRICLLEIKKDYEKKPSLDKEILYEQIRWFID